MNINLIEQLHEEGLISGDSYAKLKSKEEEGILSVHWEIKTLLYLGVLLLSAGLGILIYKNIDSIGHQFILLFIGLVCAGSFFYCFKNKFAFSIAKVRAPNAYFDYILLLACCTFITFIAYLQFQYNVFGNRYGLASFFPMLVLFLSAYYFDHLGILSMAIVNLGAWVGITVTPLQILASNDFNSTTIILTALGLGVFLILAAFVTKQRNFKKHFEFTYANFGTHIVMISCLAAMFHFTVLYVAWFILLLAIAFYFYKNALLDRSFYFIVVITLYVYIGLSYVIINILSYMTTFDLAPLYLGFLYFIVSGVGLVMFLIRTNKKLKLYDSL